MRAAIVEQPGPADVLRLVEDRPVPEPGPGEVSIDVEFAGVGFVDTLFRRGDFPLPTPFVPGIEATGTVRAVGDGVDDLPVGTRVGALLNDFGRASRAGGYAEVAVAHSSMTAALPDGLDAARACAALINGVTAWLALVDLARVRPTDSVLVLGATGGLGATVARLAASRPVARVIGVAGSDVSRLPAECTDAVLVDDLAGRVEHLTGGRGVDVVIDPVGGAARTSALAALAPFGRHVILGNASGEDPELSGDALWHGSAQVMGLNLGSVAHLVPELVRSALTAVLDLLARDVLADPAPDVVPLADVAEVHRALEQRRAPAKTVLRVG